MTNYCRLGFRLCSRTGSKSSLLLECMIAKGYLAGDDEKRARDLEAFFCRPDLDAIFCARGGFGSIQLIPHLTERIRSHPKVFAGYSDVTSLLNWLLQSCGMVTFHAPMVAMDFARGLSPRSRDHLWGTLTGEKWMWKIEVGEVIRSGKVQAEMLGGCLSVVVTTLGTPYEIETTGKMLFLEDVGEKPYRVERMLTHLKMAGKLERLAGLVFGDFTHAMGKGPGTFGRSLASSFMQRPIRWLWEYPQGTDEKTSHCPLA